MEHCRDEETEVILRDIIAQGSDAVFSFLNDTDGLEGQGEEAGNYDGSFDPMPVQEGNHEDGSGDLMTVQEGDRDACSGDQTESGQEVYILVKPVLTS